MPELSIIIPSHSRPELLRLCLESVARYAPPRTDVIVVDDGSRDGCIASAAETFPWVRLVRRMRAGGFCSAANTGIASATSPIVQLLNDDTEVTEGWAEAALARFADERVAAVAPLVLQHDPVRQARGLAPLIDSAGDEYDLGGFARKRWTGRLWQPTVQQPSSPSAGFVWGASACAAFYRRETLLQAGGFPHHFGAYFEDVDLSFRLRRLGFEIAFEPASIVWHRVSASYGKAPTRRTLEQQSCNEERVFWRNVRGRQLFKALPRHTAVLLGKAVRRWQEGALMPWMMGRLRAVWG